MGNLSIFISISIVFAILIAMFVVAFIAYKSIKAKQTNDTRKSLPAAGADSSNYGEKLAERYRNERVQKDN